MENKSTLGPIFVLSFLGGIVLFCVLLLTSTIMLGSAYVFSSLSGDRTYPILNTEPTREIGFSTQTNFPVLSNNQSEILSTNTPELVKVIDTPTERPSATPLPITTLTPTITTEPTQTPTETPPPTATMDQISVKQTEVVQETAQVEGMFQVVNQLYGSKLIPSTEGVFHSLPIYADETAITDKFEKMSTGLSLKNFILRADVNWQVDQYQGDWVESGCGVVFREKDPGNYYLLYLSLDGRVRLKRSIDNSLVLLGRSTIFEINRQEGLAQLVLVAQKDMIRIFVNGEKKYEKFGDPVTGDISFTVINKNPYGFGTRCKMSNIEVWEMDD